MKFTPVLAVLAFGSMVAAAPVTEEAKRDAQGYGNYGDYGSYAGAPAPAGGYGTYSAAPADPVPAPAGGYGSYPPPEGGYGGYGTYRRALEYVKSLWS